MLQRQKQVPQLIDQILDAAQRIEQIIADHDAPEKAAATALQARVLRNRCRQLLQKAVMLEARTGDLATRALLMQNQEILKRQIALLEELEEQAGQTIDALETARKLEQETARQRWRASLLRTVRKGTSGEGED